MVWLPESEKFEDIFSRFDRIPACDGQTDGQTDGRTDIFPRHSPHAVINKILSLAIHELLRGYAMGELRHYGAIEVLLLGLLLLLLLLLLLFKRLVEYSIEHPAFCVDLPA